VRPLGTRPCFGGSAGGKYFEGDLLWGVERDVNDVESIVRYRITR